MFTRFFYTTAFLFPLAWLLLLPDPASAIDKVKLRGYITARDGTDKVLILDDVVRLGPGIQLEWNGLDEKGVTVPSELEIGMLVEAEGVWAGKHDFRADKVSVDLSVSDKVIREKAYIMHIPADAEKVGQGAAAQLKIDGESLRISPQSRRSWSAPPLPASVPGSKSAAPEERLLGYRVEYEGLRQPDGTIAVQSLELSVPAPPDAYEIPHSIRIARGRDPKTSTDIVEFRKGDKIQGRIKLFPVPEVQDYVRDLAFSLLPAGVGGARVGLEFRFFVIEDSGINAAAFSDGTVLVNTGLLGATQNEAQLAFVLSHEIAHVLQAHQWRHTTETRTKRVLITMAAIAGSYFVGNLSNFLGAIGLEALVNGYSRRLEDQADRIALQNMIELGYDPREGPAFSRTMIDRYSMRSTSKIFSSHNSPVLRGSFLTVQIQKQYPKVEFPSAKVDTLAFRTMKEAMGPVKVQ